MFFLFIHVSSHHKRVFCSLSKKRKASLILSESSPLMNECTSSRRGISDRHFQECLHELFTISISGRTFSTSTKNEYSLFSADHLPPRCSHGEVFHKQQPSQILNLTKAPGSPFSSPNVSYLVVLPVYLKTERASQVTRSSDRELESRISYPFRRSALLVQKDYELSTRVNAPRGSNFCLKHFPV